MCSDVPVYRSKQGAWLSLSNEVLDGPVIDLDVREDIDPIHPLIGIADDLGDEARDFLALIFGPHAAVGQKCGIGSNRCGEDWLYIGQMSQ